MRYIAHTDFPFHLIEKVIFSKPYLSVNDVINKLKEYKRFLDGEAGVIVDEKEMDEIWNIVMEDAKPVDIEIKVAGV